MKVEADIRAAQVELDAVGMMVENKRGTQIPNPLISVIDTLERRQLAMIRSMSLNQTAHDPRIINTSLSGERGKSRLEVHWCGWADCTVYELAGTNNFPIITRVV